MKFGLLISLVCAALVFLTSCDQGKTSSGVSDKSVKADLAATSQDGTKLLLRKPKTIRESHAAGHVCLEPRANRVWKVGQTRTIRWRSDRGGTVQIFIYQPGWGPFATGSRTITARTANDGRYRWRIPSSINPSSRYYIGVQTQQNSIVAAYCPPGENDYFTIQAAGPSNCLTALTLGRKVGSSFSASCPSTKRAGAYAKYYFFTLTRTKRVTINLKSSRDTYLNLLKGRSTSGRILKFDDDGGPGRNSRIVTTLSRGTYTIEATTYYQRKSGRFVLSTSAISIGGGGTTSNGSSGSGDDK
jgi:hypothetical protein